MSNESARRVASHDEQARTVWQGLVDLVFSNKERFASAAAEFDLNPPLVCLLRSLTPGIPVPMSRLAAALSCDASNVTNLVDRLESRGLIERQSDPADRRIRNIALTRAGSRLREQVLLRAFTPPEAITRLTPADITQLNRLLKKMLDARAQDAAEVASD